MTEMDSGNVSVLVGVQLKMRLSPINGQTSNAVLPDTLYLPTVLGESFDITEDFRHEDFVTAAGEFSAPLGSKDGSPMLKSFGTDTLTCDWNPAWMTHPHQDPEKVKNRLSAIGRSREPVELLAKLTRHYAGYSDFHGAVTLRSITRSLRRGEPDARYFTLEFREWEELVGDRSGGGGGGGGGHNLPTSHELDGNDTLRSLARRYYGSEDEWERIAQANGLGGIGGNDPIVDSHKFGVGDKIKIPERGGKDDRDRAMWMPDPVSGQPGTFLRVDV